MTDCWFPGPTNPAHEANWLGAYYELTIKLGDHDDARLEAVVKALWQAAGFTRVYHRGAHGIEERDQVRVSAEFLLTGKRLGSVADIPGLGATVCEVILMREAIRSEDGPEPTGYGADWLSIMLPLGALSNLDPRVGGYPFDDAPSRPWREPIEEWFADIGHAVFARAPFPYAFTGFDVDATDPDDREVTSGWVGLMRATDDGALVVERPTQW